MDEKEISQEDTLSLQNSFETPSKVIKMSSCPDTTVSQVQYIKRQVDLQTMIRKLKQSQTQQTQIIVSRSQKTQAKYFVGLFMLLVFFFMFFIAFYVESIYRLQMRISQLQFKSRDFKSQIQEIHKQLVQKHQIIQALHSSYQKVKQQIIDLHMNELIKQQKSMHIFQKYSNNFNFDIDLSVQYIPQNFNIRQSKSVIRKISDQVLMFYSSKPIPQNQIYYIKIKITDTLLGMIGFGIMTEKKRHQKCVYCDSTQMLYLYCSNGKIYNGQYFHITAKSKSSKFQSVKKGDTVTMFIDNKQRKIIWYVNSRYAGSEQLKDIDKALDIYPFIEMSSRGDQIIILQ